MCSNKTTTNTLFVNIGKSVKFMNFCEMKLFSRLYVQWRFMRGIEAQFLALQKGFNEIIPQHLLRPFDERELEVCHWQ